MFHVLRVCDSLISAQPLVLVRDICRWDADIEAQVQRRMHLERCLFALEFLYGLIQHLEVHVEAHGGDVAVLLPTEQVARAPQLQIQSGDLEACAEIGKLAQRSQPFAGDFTQFRVARNQQVRVRAPVRAAHAPP